jgi:hypothetical protein
LEVCIWGWRAGDGLLGFEVLDFDHAAANTRWAVEICTDDDVAAVEASGFLGYVGSVCGRISWVVGVQSWTAWV